MHVIMPPFGNRDKARFWRKVSVREPDECWLWTAGKLDTGYGIFSMLGRSLHSNRVAYWLWHGIDPGPLLVCHTCDVRECCNPRHLWLGTNADNLGDMVLKERQARGGGNGRAKLSDADVAEIRTLYAAGGVLQRELGARFGVSQPMIGFIVRGENWRHTT